MSFRRGASGLAAVRGRLPAPVRRRLGHVRRAILTVPRDEAAAWTLERPEDPDLPYLDVLRFGACDFRETEHAHVLSAPVGWPRHLSDELEGRGVALAFQNLFVWHLADFPDAATMRKRRRRRRGRPDLVVIQTGGYAAMRHVLGFNVPAFLLREHLGRLLGPAMHPVWRAMSVGLLLVGRRVPYIGPEPGLRSFVACVREEWPGVPIELWEQSEPVLAGFWDAQVGRRLIAETAAVARELGIPVVPAPPVPATMALRGANGANFNARGSRAVATWYAGHLLGATGVEPRSARRRERERE